MSNAADFIGRGFLFPLRVDQHGSIALSNGAAWAGPILWSSYRDRGGDTNDTETWFGLIAPDGRRKPAYDTFRRLAAADRHAPITNQPSQPDQPAQPLSPAPDRAGPVSVDAAREAIKGTRPAGPGTDRGPDLAAADAAAHPDDLDADSDELGGADLLARELGAKIIEEIPNK